MVMYPYTTCDMHAGRQLPMFYVVVVELEFYGPSTHFRSFPARSVDLATLFLESLLGSLQIFSAHSFASN